jgi:hypothetical protein
MDEPDAIILTFSSVDRNSFESLSEIIPKIRQEVTNEPLIMAMATHADRYLAAEVNIDLKGVFVANRFRLKVETILNRPKK